MVKTVVSTFKMDAVSIPTLGFHLWLHLRFLGANFVKRGVSLKTSFLVTFFDKTFPFTDGFSHKLEEL